MYRDDDSLVGNVLGTLFMAGFYLFAYKSGERNALRQVADENKEAEIARLRKKLNELEGRKI